MMNATIPAPVLRPGAAQVDLDEIQGHVTDLGKAALEILEHHCVDNKMPEPVGQALLAIAMVRSLLAKHLDGAETAESE